MKKLLFLFYSLMLLLVTLSVSSCKKGSSYKKGCDSDCIEHCTIYFKDGTKKEFDIDSKYQLNCGLEKYDSYPGTFHIYLNYNDYVEEPKEEEQAIEEREPTGESDRCVVVDDEDPFYTGDRCCMIGKKKCNKDGCLKEMKRLAEKIGDGRMVEDGCYGGYNTLRFGSLKNVIGYSYRFKNHERTIRLFPESSYPIEHYTIFFKDGTKKEFSIDSKYELYCTLGGKDLAGRKYYGMDDYNNDDNYTGTHITTFDICLNCVYDKDEFYKFGPAMTKGHCFIDGKKITAVECLKEIKRLSKEIGDGKVEKNDFGFHVCCYTFSIPSLKNVTGYSLRSKYYEKTIRLF